MGAALKRAASIAGLVVLAAVAAGGWGLAAPAPVQEILSLVRTNNSTDLVTFKINPARSDVLELRIRPGNLAITMIAIEIEYDDGSLQRHLLQETLPPGHQSKPITVESRRAMTSVLLTKTPGARDGENVLQLLGRIDPP